MRLQSRLDNKDVERIERIDVNRADAPLGSIGDTDNLIEALDQLLCGA